MNRIDSVLSEGEQKNLMVTVWQAKISADTQCAALTDRIEDKRKGQGEYGPEILELAAAENGVEAGEMLALAKKLRREHHLEMPLALCLSFHQVFRYGLEAFTDACMEAGVDGIRIPDLPMEEQPQLKVYLLKEGAPYLLQGICPQSGDRIPDVTGYAKGYVYCTADPALWDEQLEYGNMLSFFLYAAEAVCPIPLILDFKNMDREGMQPYLETAAGMTVHI